MDIISLTIPVRILAKKNRMVIRKHRRTGKRFIAPDQTYRDWELMVQKLVMVQLPRGFQRIRRYVELEAMFYYFRYEPDTSGCLESIGDALEGVVWTNDKYLRRVIGDKKKDNNNPRIELVVRELK